MQHKQEDFIKGGPHRAPYIKPSVQVLGKATPEEIALAKTGPAGMAKLVERLRAAERL